MKGFRAILIKEFQHIFRDRKTLAMVFVIPVVMIILFGYAISNEIKNTKIAILNHAHDPLSYTLIEKVTSTNYFQNIKFLHGNHEIEEIFREGKVRLVLVIPDRFEQSFYKEKNATVQLVADASDLNNTVTLVNYMQTIVSDFQAEQNVLLPNMQPFQINVKMEYNPEMKSVYMFVPGNIAMVMVIVTALMASITLSREKESGSMRMLTITPIRPIFVILGKILPYMIISFFSAIVILLMAVFIFQMPINGGIALLLLICLIFMLTAASFGILVSTFAPSQQVAMIATMMGLFMPTMLLSGFIFPIENMPWILRVFSNIVPSTWFIIAIKDVMIKGAGFVGILKPFLILILLNIVLITITLQRISKK
ncbi:MAG: ABC transporter permease [Bacteroidales bacterium]|jgi:ABC-2 type transport system permease protein|nr:ABC transporter permease [Bacteroidales bacterium]